MRTNQSKWAMAACFVVALAGVGCGDDDPADAGTMAGSGGAAGTAGMAGMAGGGGAGGPSPAVMQCTTATVAKIGAARSACADCVCTKSTALALACANSAQCWNLIRCGSQFNCAPGGMTDIACLQNNCAAFIMDQASTIAAMPFASPIVRGMCSQQCPSPPPDVDGGGDAGI